MPYAMALDLETPDGGVTSIAEIERHQLDRYERRSRDLGLPARCPIANTRKCPRFFMSLATLSNTRSFVGMTREELEADDAFWRDKTLIPPVAEEEPFIHFSGEREDKIVQAGRFCPEVMFRTFGVFASWVSRAGDRLDVKNRHDGLLASRVPIHDWRWVFRDISERHYTECEEWPVYSPEAAPAETLPVIRLSESEERAVRQHRFKSRLPIQVTGQTEARKANVVLIDGLEVIMPDAQFRLFLRLVVALHEVDDGYISLGTLRSGGGITDEGIAFPEGIHQAVSRLRLPLRPALRDLKPGEFIQVSMKRIRLSTHRRYVLFNRDQLARHPGELIRSLALRLPSDSG